MSSIAKRLREFRAAVGLTQREVASMCGLGKRTIIYWEMGDREIKCSRLVPLVHEYDLDFNWLILGKGSMFNEVLLSESVSQEIPEEKDIEISESETLLSQKENSYLLKKDQEDVLPLIQRLRRK